MALLTEDQISIKLHVSLVPTCCEHQLPVGAWCLQEILPALSLHNQQQGSVCMRPWQVLAVECFAWSGHLLGWHVCARKLMLLQGGITRTPGCQLHLASAVHLPVCLLHMMAGTGQP
jgi:hypothetical protein